MTATGKDDNPLQAYFDRGQALAGEGDLQGALETVEEGLIAASQLEELNHDTAETVLRLSWTRCDALESAGAPSEAQLSALDSHVQLAENLIEQGMVSGLESLILAEHKRFRLFHSKEQLSEALQAISGAIDLGERLRHALGADWPAECQFGLARAYGNRANLRSAIGRPREALEDYNSAIDLGKRLGHTLGEDWPAQYQHGLASAYNNRASLRRAMGRPGKALDDYSSAIDLSERLRHALGEDWPTAYQHVLASTYSNRATLRSAMGRPREALDDCDTAIDLGERLRHTLGEDWPAEYQHGLASAYNNRALLRGAMGRPREALEDCDSAIDLGECLRHILAENWPAEYQHRLALAYMNRANLRRAMGRPREALDDYDTAIDLGAHLPHTLGEDWPAGYQQGLALAHMNRANLRSAMGRPREALEDYDTAIDLGERLRHTLGEDWPAEYQHSLANAYGNRAILRNAMGRPREALEDYDSAIDLGECLRHTLGEDWPAEYQHDLAGTYGNRALLRRAMALSREALDDCDSAIDLGKRLRHTLAEDWPAEYQYGSARAYGNRAILRSTMGRPRDALKDYDSAIDLAQRLRHTLAEDWPAEYQHSLTGTYSNRALLRHAMGRPRDALEDYDSAIELAQRLRHTLGEDWPAECQHGLSLAYSNRANLLRTMSRLGEALEDYDSGIDLGERLRHTLGEDWPAEYQHTLAGTYSNRALLRSAMGRPREALDDYESAIDLGERLRHTLGKAWPAEYQHGLALAYSNRALLRNAMGRAREAWSDCGQANDLIQGVPAGLSFDCERGRFRIATCGANLLAYQLSPEQWAVDTSRTLAAILETHAPPIGIEAAEPWRPMYADFLRFHQYWLAWCVDTGHTEQIPEALSILQGREMAASFVEEITERAGLPRAIEDYLNARTELREVRTALARALEQLSRPYLGGHEMPGERHIPPATTLTNSPELKAEVDRLSAAAEQARERVERARAEAAKVPGYEDLSAAYHPIRLAALQASLADDEALVVLFEIPDPENNQLTLHRALLCRVREPARVVELGALGTIAEAIRGFRPDSVGSRQAYRRSAVEAPEAQVSGADFWDRCAEAMREGFWAPLQADSALEGVSHVHVLTHGLTHLLPLSLGKNEAHTVWRFPGLALYQRLRARTAGASSLQHIGVLAHRGDDPLNRIPMVEAEADMIARRASAQLRVSRPALYPLGTADGEVPDYDLLHIACHGQLYTDPQHGILAPALHAAPGQHYTAHDLLGSVSSVRHVYAGACLAGRVDQDLSGAPAGVVIAWLQRGARSVCGSLVSLPDHGAWLLGCLYHQGLEEGLDPLAALHRAQHKLAVAAEHHQEGQPPWDPATRDWLERHAGVSQRGQLERQLRERLNLLRAYAGADNSRLNWLEKALWEGELAPWLATQGVGAEALAELQQALSDLQGDDSRPVIEQFVERVLKRLPPAPELVPPEQPHLGALLYGMTAFGRLH